MKVEIKAQTIEQIMNADVIYADQVRSLPDAQQRQLLERLINELSSHSDQLLRAPMAISEEQVKALAGELRKAAASTSPRDGEVESRGAQISKVLAHITDSLGGVADIVLTAVKLGQVAGVLKT
jgi:hypothetical protein